MSQYHAHDNQEVDESGVKRKGLRWNLDVTWNSFFSSDLQLLYKFFFLNGSVSEWLSKSIAVDHSVK